MGYGYRSFLSDEDMRRRAGILGYDPASEHGALDTGFNLTGQAQRPPLLAPQFSTPARPSYNTIGGQPGRIAPSYNTNLGNTAVKAGASFLAGGPVGLGVSLAGDTINYLSSGDQRAFNQEQRNNARWAWGKAKRAYGTDVINPGQTMWASHAAMLPRMNALGEGLDRKYGFDSGRAGGYLAEQQLSAEAQAWLDAYLQNAGLKTSRDTNILGMLGG
jgi:hypothetical protein